MQMQSGLKSIFFGLASQGRSGEAGLLKTCLGGFAPSVLRTRCKRLRRSRVRRTPISLPGVFNTRTNPEQIFQKSYLQHH